MPENTPETLRGLATKLETAEAAIRRHDIDVLERSVAEIRAWFNHAITDTPTSPARTALTAERFSGHPVWS